MAGWLDAMTMGSGLWRHQARALALHADGRNVVLATGTASGKSLAFMAPAMRMLLESEGTVLVIYPQKALSGDQLVRWQDAMELAELPRETVGEIHGDIAIEDREPILKQARVLLATPDVLHAWMLRLASSPVIRSMLARLSLIVIDEAHALDGIFGSNCAFFFRRLQLAAARARHAEDRPAAEIAFMAASATIADPAWHLEALTGLPFEAIGEEDNGAPFHGLTVFHIDGPDHGTPAEALLAEIVSTLAGEIGPNDALIAFLDGRQAVERTTQRIERADVLPYRSGFEHLDRRQIEQGLRDGRLLGVIATSALEMGVDIARFRFGLNQGLPFSRKSFRQRIGRIGRTRQGAFALIAPSSVLAKLGTTLEEFVAGPVEASPLYLDNQIIQLQQACCLFDELEGAPSLENLPGTISWPAGFVDAYAMAQPGARRPRDIEQLLSGATGCPHFDYPLRKIGQSQFALRLPRQGNALLSTIDDGRALQEAYPGAIYRHLRRSYRVTGWHVSSFERSIQLEPIKSSAKTIPLLRSVVTASHAPEDLFEGRLLASASGSITETCLQVTESVEGYALGGETYLYRDLSQKDRRKRRQQRRYSSTGILIRVDEPWFAGTGERQIAMRLQVADAFKALLTREYAIVPAEIRTAHSGISIQHPGGPRPVQDAIAIFDNVQGGLRLVEPLFAAFPHFLERLRRGAELAGGEAMLESSAIARLEAWYASLEPGLPQPSQVVETQQGERLIYAPESEVGVPIKGVIAHRKLLGHQTIAIGEVEHLAYRYETDGDALGLVLHDQIVPIGSNWRQVLWDPTTDQVREIEA